MVQTANSPLELPVQNQPTPNFVSSLYTAATLLKMGRYCSTTTCQYWDNMSVK